MTFYLRRLPMGDHDRNTTARDAIASEVRGHVQGAAVGAVDDYIISAMESAGGELATIARARIVVGRVLALWGLIESAWDMLIAGYAAMTVPRKQVARIAAAHAFGYWMFDYRIGSKPQPPQTLIETWQREDNIGNYDRIRSSEFRQIWNRSVRTTIIELENNLANSQISVVRAELTRRLPGASVHDQSDSESRNLLKTILGSQEFNNNPRSAAAAFFLASIADDSRMENSVLIRMYRRWPYRPTSE
jgi:hypothetical protein